VSLTVTNLATNQARSVVTNEDGLYRFAGLMPGRYSLNAQLDGFAGFSRPELTLQVGGAVDIDVVMRLSTLEETVTVTGEAPLIEAARTDVSTVISRQQIEELPSNNRSYLDFALLTPGAVENTSTTSQGIGLNIGGARAKEGSLLVDGFWNTDESFTFPRIKYSQDAIAEFQVVSFGGAAEVGRAIGGVINAVTKSGGNVPFGSAYSFFRSTKLNAQDFISKARGIPPDDFNRKLVGASFGGPIVPNRMFFFGSTEWLAENTPRDNQIRAEDAAALGLPAGDVGAINRPLRDTFAMGKVNYNAGRDHSLQLVYAMTKDRNESTGIANRSTRSRQTRLQSLDHAYQFGWTAITRGGNWLHELRASYFPRDYMLDAPDEGGAPLTPDGQLRSTNAPQVNITNVANFGGGRITNEMFTRPVHAVYSSTISRQTHAIKFGIDGMFVDFVYLRYPTTGSYSFRTLDHYRRGEYTTYSQTFGDPQIDRTHTYASAFVQDSWTATDRMTINYGLRYDLEWLSKYHGLSFGEDHNNVSPRFALSYDLSGSGRTIAKVSTGVYFDRIFQNPITPTFLENRDYQQQISAQWTFGQPGAPVYPNTFGPSLADMPANAPLSVRNAYIVPEPGNMEVPASYQLSTTLDHAFTSNFAMSFSFVYSWSWNKERLFNRNFIYDEERQLYRRVDLNFNQINQYSFEGNAEYFGYIIDAQRRLTDKLRFGANLTFARAFDHGNNFSSGVDDVRYPEREWGEQADTPHFRIAANGSYSLSRAIQASAIFRYRTGGAIDPRTGSTYDINGDGAFNDRTPTFARNSFRKASNHSLDARLTWALPMPKGRLQLMLEGFNLYNQANVLNTNSTYGPTPGSPDPLFGTVTQYNAPREVQLGLRFVF
jgi:hypothetical protein